MGQCCGILLWGSDDNDSNNENASLSPCSSPAWRLSRRCSCPDAIPPPPTVGFAATPTRPSAVSCHKEMDSQEVFSAASLPDDLVVEILSRLPLKTFCRFKCVCKAWLAFSSNPHYNQKLPKFPTGFFHGGKGGSAIQLVSLYPNDVEIDGALKFLPHYKHLEFADCCNGLVLCKYRYTSSNICRFVVCNPATQEWRMLPDTYREPYPYDYQYTAFLAFDPSWSAQFYVLCFKKKSDVGGRFGNVISELWVFSSGLSRWLMDEGWNSAIDLPMDKQYFFIGGKFYLKTPSHDVLVFEGLEAISFGIPPCYFTIKLPHDVWCFEDGCFGQSMGFLQCAFPEKGDCAIAVHSLDAYSHGWSPKHRISMKDALGRDDFLCSDDGNLPWPRDYKIVSLDLERGVIFLVNSGTNKLISYNINTGKRSEIHDDFECHYFGARYANQYYVASYSKLPLLSRAMYVM
ncbi:uncharacterized protein LOC100828981 [Brachypodium distachyon]|uniref:F-box domain-containing protein n=1 Tax=Brachypodium distachyon TaxID=15368 RepID=A0A0Q3IFZ5_BRADI|nr:uncharacterized protein LOC100828981 [Brachypodium distachyon]KQK04835.1 hypothetical protein BRADI_2g16250v3 [Brachypodium distachyon]|eukprot:XP_003565903.2 uncharacterized protein LOC100828981 [Brachypodium distachyon]